MGDIVMRKAILSCCLSILQHDNPAHTQSLGGHLYKDLSSGFLPLLPPVSALLFPGQFLK